MNKLRIAAFIGLALMLALSLVLVACGEPEPEPAPTPAPAPSPTPAPAPAPAEPIVLRWGHCVTNTTHYSYIMATDAAKAIETRSEGQLVVEVYPAGAVCDAKENPDALISGVLDIGWVMLGYEPGLFPKSELLSLPVVWPTGEDRSKLDLEVLYPEIVEPEWESAGLIFLGYPQPDSHELFTTEKPVRSLDDLKGLKLCTNSEAAGSVLAALGAAVTVLPGSQTYLALEKGTVEGSAMYPASAKMSKYEEACHFLTLINFGVDTVGYWAANPYTLNEILSPDLAEIVKEEVRGAGKARGDRTQQDTETAMQYFKDQGIEVITLPAEAHEIIRQTAESQIEAWIAAQEEAGMKDAREFAEYVSKLFE